MMVSSVLEASSALSNAGRIQNGHRDAIPLRISGSEHQGFALIIFHGFRHGKLKRFLCGWSKPRLAVSETTKKSNSPHPSKTACWRHPHLTKLVDVDCE